MRGVVTLRAMSIIKQDQLEALSWEGCVMEPRHTCVQAAAATNDAVPARRDLRRHAELGPVCMRTDANERDAELIQLAHDDGGPVPVGGSVGRAWPSTISRTRSRSAAVGDAELHGSGRAVRSAATQRADEQQEP